MASLLEQGRRILGEPGVAGNPPVTNCQKKLPSGELCDVPLPAEGEDGYHSMRKYCDEHQPKNKKPKDPAPKITVDLRPGKSAKGSKLEVYEEGASRLLGFVPLLVASDEVCAPAITQSLPAIAHQLALLAEYHPTLAKVLSPGEGTGEAMAWFGLVMAASPILLTVCVHHNLLPEKMLGALNATIAAAG